MTISIIKHEAVPNCGSYEVKYSDGQPSRFILKTFQAAGLGASR
jgi:hypothetical protein